MVVAPSPQFHVHELIEPSGSVEAEPSTDAVRLLTLVVKLAVGATLPPAPRPTA